jgi:hypothetical protein
MVFASTPGVPRLQLTETSFDFGEALEGSTVSHDFSVSNTGSAVLKIDQVGPACVCMKADFDESIAPGGKGKISLTVDLTGYKGPLEMVVMVVSNDPENPDTSLSIKGTAKPRRRVVPEGAAVSRSTAKPSDKSSLESQIVVKPKSITLGMRPSQKTAFSTSVTITHKQKKAFQITGLIYDKKLLRAISKPLPKKDGFSLQVRVNMENIPAGTLVQTALGIRTDLDPKTTGILEIRVYNIKQQTLSPRPKKVGKVR